MRKSYADERRILPSVCDHTARLSYADTFAIFMDIATAHAEAMGIGMWAMAKRGLFWLTVKTKIRFYHRPRMLDTVMVETFPLAAEKLRSVREYAIKKDEETLILGKTEWAVLETDSGRLHRMEDIFPSSLELGGEPWFPDAFVRIDEDFAAAAPLGTYQVRSTDIDLGGHMNNVAYVRALMGLFPAEQWENAPIHEIEVIFRSSCYEGNILHFFAKNMEYGMEVAAFLADTPEGKPVFTARLITE